MSPGVRLMATICFFSRESALAYFHWCSVGFSSWSSQSIKNLLFGMEILTLKFGGEGDSPTSLLPWVAMSPDSLIPVAMSCTEVWYSG